MKFRKRLVSALLSVTMLMSSCLPVFATGEPVQVFSEEVEEVVAAEVPFCEECSGTDAHDADCPTRCSCGENKLEVGHVATCMLYRCEECSALLNQTQWIHKKTCSQYVKVCSCDPKPSEGEPHSELCDFYVPVEENETLDFSSDIGKIAIFDVSDEDRIFMLANDYTLEDIDNQLILLCEEIPADLKMVIRDYYVDSLRGLWYLVDTEDGNWPEIFEDCKWVFQDYLDDSQGNCLILTDPEEDEPDEPVIVVPPVTEDNIQQETVWGETVEYEESETSAPVSVAFGNANSVSAISFDKGDLAELIANSQLENPSYQWQIYASDNEEWVDIAGQNQSAIIMSYGIVASLLNHQEALVRCEVSDGENVEYSEEITVSINDETVTEEAISSAGVSPMMMALALAAEEPEAQADDENYTITINYLREQADRTYTQAAKSWVAELPKGATYVKTVMHPNVVGYAIDEELTLQNIDNVGNVTADLVSFNLVVNGDIVVDVYYKPATVNYTVNHYIQNADNDDFTPVKSETFSGLTGSTPAGPLEKVLDNNKDGIYDSWEAGFEGTYPLHYNVPTIAADGSTVIEIYYNRFYYLMSFDLGGGYGVNPVYDRYGATIDDVGEPIKAGYSFDGWADGDGNDVTLPTTMPAVNTHFVAKWKAVDAAKVTIVYWGENADNEEYSYLPAYTKEFYAKPGTELKYGDKITCGFTEEHTHNNGCIGCGKEAHFEHSLANNCYTLTCVQASHTHIKECYGDAVGDETQTGTIGKPNNPKEGQVYKGYLGTYIYIKGKWYNYSGSVQSGALALTVCGKAEQTHTHVFEDCYEFTCTKEVHSHDVSCYTCGKAAHQHTDDCELTIGESIGSALWTYVRSDTITVEADGSSVLNVYFDRTTFTMTFKATGSNGKTLATITDKWGADIRTRFENVSKANTFLWSRDTDGDSPWTSFMDRMPQENRTYYAKTTTSSSVHTATYYGEKVDGSGYDVLYTSSVKYGSNLTVSEEEFIEIKGYIFNSTASTKTGASYNGAKFYYDRANYAITFNDGYDDVKSENVEYQAPLSTYNSFVPEVPSAYEPGSVQFAGWYLNPQCTGAEYKLDEHTMPADGLLLYAKWAPVTHKVSFYLDWESLNPKEGEPIPIKKKNSDEEYFELGVAHGSPLAEGQVPTEDEVKKEITVIADGKETQLSLTFEGWFYKDDETGEEVAFLPSSMQVRQSLDLYAKWSSNIQVNYTVRFVTRDAEGNFVDIAAPFTGSDLVGRTKTFEAKVGKELYEQYQNGYFTTLKSHSITMDINGNNTYVFEYVQANVDYTVEYRIGSVDGPYAFILEDGRPVAAPANTITDGYVKEITTNNAVVTETALPLEGYLADQHQKILELFLEEENKIVFVYKENKTDAWVIVRQFLQVINNQGNLEYVEDVDAFNQFVGKINTTYKASDYLKSYTGYQYKKSEINGTEQSQATLTKQGMEICLYYDMISYGYEVRYLKEGTNEPVAVSIIDSELFGTIITGTAKDVENYDLVGDVTEQKLTITEIAANNVITFYYKEKEVKIQYVAVAPGYPGATGFGVVNPSEETVQVLTGVAEGSEALSSPNWQFEGWYSDEACTTKLGADLKFVPTKKGVAWTETTYYAKFAPKLGSLTLSKKLVGQEGKSFNFNVTLTWPQWYTTPIVSGEGEKQITFVSGEASNLILGNGDTVVINNIPFGTSFSLEENLSDSEKLYYDTTVTINGSETPQVQDSVAGQIAAETQSYLFTNTYSVGSLIISKDVIVPDGKTMPDGWIENLYDFTLNWDSAIPNDMKYQIYQRGINGEPDKAEQPVSITGDVRFQLKDNQYLKITDVPAGTKYSVSETEVAGFSTTVNGISSLVTDGVVEKDETETASYENMYLSGSLQISKVVELQKGATRDMVADKVFTFNVTLPEKAYSYALYQRGYDADGNLGEGKSIGTGTLTHTDAVYSIQLKDGQYVVITDVPVGDYSITETAIPENFECQDGELKATITRDGTDSADFINVFPVNFAKLKIRKEGGQPGESYIVHVKGGNTELSCVVTSGQTVELPEILITNLTEGITYTITEDSTWAWRYDASYTHTTDGNTYENGNVIKIQPGENNIVVINNELKDNKWLNTQQIERNTFTQNSGDSN